MLTGWGLAGKTRLCRCVASDPESGPRRKRESRENRERARRRKVHQLFFPLRATERILKAAGPLRRQHGGFSGEIWEGRKNGTESEDLPAGVSRIGREASLSSCRDTGYFRRHFLKG